MAISKLIKLQLSFRSLCKTLLPISLFLTIGSFGTGLYQALFVSPIDYQQGNTVRIMYVHVPAAWMALSIYSAMAIANLAGFIWKNPFFLLFSRAIAPVGAMFTLITLITGSLWGKPIWGAWWVWDARLTSMLILFFLYIAYIILLSSFNDRNKGEKIAAIISVVGFINIPIIKFSVEFWNSLHQPASILRSGGIAIDPSMLKPLLLMSFAYINYSLFITLLRIKSEILINKINRLELNILMSKIK